MPVTLLKSKWSSGNLVFHQSASDGDASVSFGEDDTGVDVYMYGATASKYVHWDQSADALKLVGAAFQPGAAGVNFATNITAGAGVFNLDGTASYLMDFAATAKGGITLTADGMSQNPETASEDGFLAILVGASIYEIPVYLRT